MATTGDSLPDLRTHIIRMLCHAMLTNGFEVEYHDGETVVTDKATGERWVRRDIPQLEAICAIVNQITDDGALWQEMLE